MFCRTSQRKQSLESKCCEYKYSKKNKSLGKNTIILYFVICILVFYVIHSCKLLLYIKDETRMNLRPKGNIILYF